MSPFCAELLCPTEQAQLDILNPQVQACCDELICNESFWIQVHCHELELFFLYWWYQNLKCYFQVSYLLLGSQIGFFLNEKGLTQGILRRYFLTPDHFSNTSTLITSGTSLQWLSYKVTHLRPSIVRVKGDLQRISRQPLSVEHAQFLVMVFLLARYVVPTPACWGLTDWPRAILQRWRLTL